MNDSAASGKPGPQVTQDMLVARAEFGIPKVALEGQIYSKIWQRESVSFFEILFGDVYLLLVLARGYYW